MRTLRLVCYTRDTKHPNVTDDKPEAICDIYERDYPDKMNFIERAADLLTFPGNPDGWYELSRVVLENA